jgi:hypothetical protein
MLYGRRILENDEGVTCGLTLKNFPMDRQLAKNVHFTQAKDMWLKSLIRARNSALAMTRKESTAQ